jgi:hypothetical protein
VKESGAKATEDAMSILKMFQEETEVEDTCVGLYQEPRLLMMADSDQQVDKKDTVLLSMDVIRTPVSKS